MNTLRDRIEANSMPVTECGCWIWLGSIGGKRYGSLRIDGKSERSNRAAWQAYRGEIPEGMHVLHSCDMPLCVNPDHLFLGDHLVNMQDKERKGRGNHASGARHGRQTKPWRTSRGDDHYARNDPSYRQGSKNGRSKLTDMDVLAIRASDAATSDLAAVYGVERHCITKIRSLRSWRHL